MPWTKKVLDFIAASVRTLEDLIAHVAGPVLAVGMGIGLIDIITGGALLVDSPSLLFVWAGTQSAGVDVMLPMMADRTIMSFRSRQYGSGVFYATMTLILGYVAFLGAAAFTLQQTEHASLNAALGELGVTPFAFVIGRAVLAVLMVVLAGVLRQKPEVLTAEQVAAKMREEMELAPLKAQYAQMKRRQMLGGLRGTVQLAKATVRGGQLVEESPDDQQDAQPEGDALGGAVLQLVPPSKQLTAQQRMRKVYSPGMKVAHLAKLAGVQRSTAKRYIEQQSPAQAQSAVNE